MRTTSKLLLLPVLALCAPCLPAHAEPLQAGTYHEAVRCAAIDTIMSAVLQMDEDPKSKGASERLDTMSTRWLAVADTLKPGTREALAADYTLEANAVTDVATNAGSGSAAEKAMDEDMAHCIKRELAIFP